MDGGRSALIQEASVERLTHSALSLKVYETLRDCIMNRKFLNGQKLNPKALATSLGVSTTPVREALVRLAREGLVEIVPRSYTRVVSPSARDITETYEVRKALEKLAVAAACLRMTDPDIDELEQALRQAEDMFKAGDKSGFIKSDRFLHDRIIAASGNSLVAKFLEVIQCRCDMFRCACAAAADLSIPRSLQAHRRIIEAIRRRDIAGAKEAMDRHIEEAKSIILEAFPIESADTDDRLERASI